MRSTDAEDSAVCQLSQAQVTKKYTTSHIDENCESIPSGTYENELFHGCSFKTLKNVTFKNCNLQYSKLLTDRIADALGLTVTLDCHTFEKVELSPLLFDLLLILLIKTSGNTEKRKQLIEVVGRERVYELLKQMERIE